MTRSRLHQRWIVVIATLVALLGLISVSPVVWRLAGRPAVDRSKRDVLAPTTLVPPAPSPEQIARPHLEAARRECEQIIEEHLHEVDRFFADSKRHTPAFANAALSWGSKWRLVADHVPFTKGGRHERFLRARFEEFVFTPAQLESVIKQAIANYLADVRSIEGKMLVRLRADVEDFPTAYPLAGFDDAQLQTKYDEALRKAMESAGGQMQADIGGQLVSIIAGEVLTQVAVRLGVSAGILGTGAASGWATLGIGVVVGLIVDQIVSWVWDWWSDPKANLAAELNKKLDEMRTLISDGGPNVEGLGARLGSFAEDRAKRREQAVMSLFRAEANGG